MIVPARLRLVMLAVVALAVLPVLLAPVPGFVDLPSHMARHHVLANIGHEPALAATFAVQWQWIGNLGADLPSVLLNPLLGSDEQLWSWPPPLRRLWSQRFSLCPVRHMGG